MSEEKEKIRSFRDLKIWQRGIALVEEIYEITSQLRRAAVSIPSNISEGFMRFHSKEYIQFLYISLGSSAELATQIEIASRLRFLEGSMAKRLIQETEEISKMVMGLIKSLRYPRPANPYPLSTND